jgi:NAD(P)H-flavin reductase
MHTGKGQVLELILEDGIRHVRISCPSNLIPSPGQYLLASDGSNAPLPVPLFYTDSAPQGGSMATPASAGSSTWRHFIAAGVIPGSWNPGTELQLRGPLGRGFDLPLSARKVGLVAFDVSPARLTGLIQPALKQDAGVVIVCDSNPGHLPEEVEVQPMSALHEIVEWSDYLAFDVEREKLNQLRERLGNRSGRAGKRQISSPRCSGNGCSAR